ncbi:MAG: ATP-binding protein [Candidatus Eisenbacteria bacterium]|nr:ATP-binding protein [Candidatus Eisenbacteria bacterium]
MSTATLPLVSTIKDRCRVCYTCVRECPAKAIRIVDGQAEVMVDRCIGCGNCVTVCSQRAKQVISSTDEVRRLLEGPVPVVACIAPSFPAEFIDVPSTIMVAMVRALGFRWVNEVGFGADLVAREYRKLLDGNDGGRYISTTCPAVFGYVKRYHPDLIPSLAPIVSPMVAEARVLRHLHGSEIGVVFIGPCIAKKREGATDEVRGEVDSVLTFAELREMLDAGRITPGSVSPSDFDPPLAGRGSLFPITRGMLQAAGVYEDLMDGDLVAADGRVRFIEAIREFESKDLDATLLELLCCRGCIMGPGMTSREPLLRRRSRVSKYAREQAASRDAATWTAAIEGCAGIDLSRSFIPCDQRISPPGGGEIEEILARMGKTRPEDELNCGACGYDTCREHASAILTGLAESEMCLPYTIERLRQAFAELEISHEELEKTQQLLTQTEKLASMGQLAAGIAHEVNNPLGVVLLYAHLLLDQCEPGSPLREDMALIAQQADRCKKIVAGLLDFARQNKVVRQPVNLADLVDRCLKAIQIPESVRVEVFREPGPVVADLDADQITQVLINIITNALDAMPSGGTLAVRTSGDDQVVRCAVADTGVGIPEANVGRVFEPFFTTKQMGKGTGLGLAVTYGIIKMHSGDIRVVSNSDPTVGPMGSTFTVTLPRVDSTNGKRMLAQEREEL